MGRSIPLRPIHLCFCAQKLKFLLAVYHMSLFPITDIILLICAELEAEDICALILVDNATSIQLCGMLTSRCVDVVEDKCRFDVTEILIAGVVMRTDVVLCGTDFHAIHVMNILQHRGKQFTGLIRIDETERNNDQRREYFIYVKNNIAKNCAVLKWWGSDIKSIWALNHEPLYYMEYISQILYAIHFNVSCFNRGFTHCAKINSRLCRIFRGWDDICTETNVKILRIFEKAEDE